MSRQVNRLEARAGERIDRGRTVTFSFEGQDYEGHPGDTVASALAACDRWVLSRSFKYRRPRGILTMAGQDANTLVQLPGEPNVLADMLPVSDGLEVMGQNYDRSLDHDLGAAMALFGRFLPVGFYYKAFFKPRGAWRWWEKLVRNRAGLGRIDRDAPHGFFDKAYGWYDVVVVGGGPAGMAAALEADQAGANVLLVDENPGLGGSLEYTRLDPAGQQANSRRAALVAGIRAASAVEVMTSATCNGWFTDNWLPVIQGNRMHKIRAGQVVLATGAIEQPIVFRNNDLPGIMQASAAQRLIRQYGVRPGRQAVVATANPDGYGAALDLLDAGVAVAAVCDLRAEPAACPLSDAVRERGVEVLPGHTVWEAFSEPGHWHVRGVTAARIAGQGRCAGAARSFDCDLLLMAPGYSPTSHLLSHAGGVTGYDGASHMFTLREVPDGLHVAGSVNGAWDIDAVIAEGRHAGWAAARAAGHAAGAEPDVPEDRGGRDRSHPWPMFPHPKGKEFVDFDEDLQIIDVIDAVAEGYEHIELLKRYSTVGMGPSQGRHSALATARLVADATGQDIAAVGRTTSRPPFTAEKLGQLAGRSFEPVRYTAMHHRHIEAGARMMIAGLWLRPAFYGTAEDKAGCVTREAAAVRQNVGLIDVSTLGGLEVRGPDAAEFLNRMYTFAYLKQPVGRSRYVLMTDESGAIVDDGVACRLEENHFYVTATTGGVDGVYRQMLWYNAQWRLDVDITNATAAWCGVNIAGPTSRQVLQRLCDDVDLSPEGFPYMGVRTGTVAGIPVRLLRVGFVGELGYEIHAPAHAGEALWDALLEAGRENDIRPFGVEAQRLLRLEKGHIIIGQDTDGLTHPHEADMTWAIARKKPWFVGGRAIRIQLDNGLERKLVGFTIDDASTPPPGECHLVIRDGDIVGRVTSAARSAAVGSTIGLAYVAPDQTAPGSAIEIRVDGGRMVRAAVCALPFYDPDNARQAM